MKKTSPLLILLFAACLAACNSGNQKVTIIGEIPNAKDSVEVNFCRSIDTNPINWCFMYDNALVKNGRFVKTFDNPAASTITIVSSFNHSFQKVHVICRNGDSIKIKYTGNGVHFEGTNAKGLELINHKKMFAGSIWDGLIAAVLEKESSLNEAVLKIEEIKNNFLKPLDSLDEKNIISKSFYKAVQTECTATLLHSVSTLVQNRRPDIKFNLNDSSLLLLAQHFFTQYDPFDSKYNITDGNNRSLIVQDKCKLIDKGVLKGTKQDIGLWSKKEDNYLVYAPVEMQQRIMTNHLLFNKYFKAENGSADSANFNLLKKHFPESPYIPVIQRYFVVDAREEKISPYSFGHFDKKEHKLTITEAKPYKSLQEFLRRKFPNQFVFIDVWATWCGPCIKEFQHADSLYKFCKNNHIELLYISVDKSSAGANWAKNIKKYELNGYHCFAADSINASITKLMGNSTGIPRYFLFGKKGNLLDGNLPKPSEMSGLTNRIRKLLLRK